MVEITTLTPDDIEAGMRLSTQAGWNQVATDWERFIDLSPNGCFAGRVDGQVVATTCLVTYEDVTWIGMVLVDEAHRCNGYGTALFEHALNSVREDSRMEIGLDATEDGASIYRQSGFQVVSPIERWSGTLKSGDSGDAATVLPPSEADAIYTLDQQAVGIDRSHLLERLLSEVGTSALGIREDGQLTGYGILRPGRKCPQLGPIIVSDPTDLILLLNGTSTVLSDPTIIVDIFPNAETTEILESYGLSKQRELVRMSHQSDRPLLNGPTIHGAVDFAWG